MHGCDCLDPTNTTTTATTTTTTTVAAATYFDYDGIQLMVSVPGYVPGRTQALVEEVDVFPTIVEAAYKGRQVVPACPEGIDESRRTNLCTEGFSMMPLLNRSGPATLEMVPQPTPTHAPRIGNGSLPRPFAFSQYVRMSEFV